MEIHGKSCIVTGASSGIGAATARHLYGLGAKVTLAARRKERLEALACELPGVRVVVTDMTNPTQVRRLVTETLATFGAIDVLVNNAGQGLHVPLLQLDPIDLRAVFELNVVAPLVATQSALPALVAAHGTVVNVSSAATLDAIADTGGYSATKAALNMLSDVARVELADKGVTVSVVYPRLTDTEFHGVLRAGRMSERARAMAKDSPELVARAIAFTIATGAAHVLVDDPPRAIDVGYHGPTRGAARATGHTAHGADAVSPEGGAPNASDPGRKPAVEATT